MFSVNSNKNTHCDYYHGDLHYGPMSTMLSMKMIADEKHSLKLYACCSLGSPSWRERNICVGRNNKARELLDRWRVIHGLCVCVRVCGWLGVCLCVGVCLCLPVTENGAKLMHRAVLPPSGQKQSRDTHIIFLITVCVCVLLRKN